MNPYLAKKADLSKKIWEWQKMTKGKSIVFSPYFHSMSEIESKLMHWDRMSQMRIKKTNNPCISEIVVKVSAGLNLCLSPRVKLIYDRIVGSYLNPSQYASMVRKMFTYPCMSEEPVYVYLDDFKSQRSLGYTTIFFRDLSFLDPSNLYGDTQLYHKIDKARDFLLRQKLSQFSFTYNHDKLEFNGRVPLSENPQQMLAQFAAAHPGYMDYRRPVIEVHNLASHWFGPPNSNKQQTALLVSFFSFFGSVRCFEVANEGELCTASVEYDRHDDFVKALKTLCCCSLRQERSHKLIDYEVSLSLKECPPVPIGITSSPYLDMEDGNLARMSALTIN